MPTSLGALRLDGREDAGIDEGYFIYGRIPVSLVVASVVAVLVVSGGQRVRRWRGRGDVPCLAFLLVLDAPERFPEPHGAMAVNGMH